MNASWWVPVSILQPVALVWKEGRRGLPALSAVAAHAPLFLRLCWQGHGRQGRQVVTNSQLWKQGCWLVAVGWLMVSSSWRQSPLWLVFCVLWSSWHRQTVHVWGQLAALRHYTCG